MRTASRASELTQRPPTITESIVQLGDPVAAHRSVRSTPRRPRFQVRAFRSSLQPVRSRRPSSSHVDRCHGCRVQFQNRTSMSDLGARSGDNRLVRLRRGTDTLRSLKPGLVWSGLAWLNLIWPGFIMRTKLEYNLIVR